MGLSAAKVARVEAEAHDLFLRLQEIKHKATDPNERAVQVHGTLPYPKACDVSKEELTTHLLTCAELSEQYHVNLDHDKLFGKTREEIDAVAQAKLKAHKRSAGARAMVRKYGKEAAERIIEQKTGKHFDLRR